MNAMEIRFTGDGLRDEPAHLDLGDEL